MAHPDIKILAGSIARSLTADELEELFVLLWLEVYAPSARHDLHEQVAVDVGQHHPSGAAG